MNTEVPLGVQIAVLAVLVGGLFLLIRTVPPLPQSSGVATSTQVSATAASSVSSSSPATASSTVASGPRPAATSKATSSLPTPVSASMPAVANPRQIHRVENPYATPPFSFEAVNEAARSALVNIFCFSNNGLLRPISGSGVIVDPRGVVLTNAHVAQYVLLAESGKVNLQCQVRYGSPAIATWHAHVLYIPPVWIDEHAQDLTKERPFGTGKHDYGLIYVGSPLDGSARSAIFPFLSPDSREAIGFVDDPVLAASYPAEFLGSMTANFNLYHVTSITAIEELFTLGSNSVDVLSVGSVIGAQSGSSGGAIVNAWARLIGIITTTSDGATTGERRLRAITLSYINRDLELQSGSSLSELLAKDPLKSAIQFSSDTAPALVEKLLRQIK